MDGGTLDTSTSPGTTPSSSSSSSTTTTSSSSSSSSTSPTSIPLWVIIVVVVAGTVVVVGTLVYGCTYLHRWRWARRHRRTALIEGREVSVYHNSFASSLSSSSSTGRSSSIIVGGGRGGRGGDQNSLFFDDVDFWRGGGGGESRWGSSSVGSGGVYEDGSFYMDGVAGMDSGRGRKLRKKRQKGGRGRSSSGGGFGGGTSSIMSGLSVGDIAMVEAGIRREPSCSTKEAGGGGGSRRQQRRQQQRQQRDRDTSDSDMNGGDNDNSRRARGRKSKATLSLPPTLPEVWRMSSGLLSVVSFQSLFNSFSNNLSINNNGPPHPRDSKETHERTSGGPHSRPGHRRQTSNAWVDEDAIHGPAVSTAAAKGKGKGKGREKGKKSSSILASPMGGRRKGGFWRRSIRESWPLRTMISPTLPKLSSPWGSPKMFGPPLFGSPKPSGGGTVSQSSTMKSTAGTFNSFYAHQGGGGYHHDGGIASSFRFPNDVPSLLPPHHLGNNDCLSYSPPRQLPKPPKQALLAASVESAGDSPLGNGFYRGSNWTTGVRTMAMANMTPSRSASGRSVSGSCSERGLLGYYKYEEMDNSNSVVLTNPYHHPMAVAGGSSGGSNSGSGGLGVAITTPVDSVVPAPLRLSSADSTLSGILRDTEKRLQDGTVTGVMARRNQRGSISPSKRALARTASGGPLRPSSASITSSATGGGGGGNEHIATLMITSAGGVHAAPSSAQPSPASSPSRVAPPRSRASGHIRQDSQASIGSEADSLFAAPSPVQDHFHPLTSPVKNGGMSLSPSGPPPQHPVPPLPLARHNSFAGSVSSSESSLPTIYSVDENVEEEGDGTRITAFGSSTSEGLNRLAGFVTSKSSSKTLDDPFVVNWPVGTSAIRMTPSPTRTVTAEKRSAGAQLSSGRSVPEFSQSPRLYGGQTSRPEASLWPQSPLEAISGNSSRAIEPQTRRSESLPHSESRIPRAQSIPRIQTLQSQRNVVLLAAPASTFSTSEGERRHENKNTNKLTIADDDSELNLLVHSSTIPNIFLTTPSEKADNSPLPRHLEVLRKQASSPTLGHGREQTPELAPPSPALSKQRSNVYDYYMDLPSSDAKASSRHRRAAGEVRKMSEASSAAYAADPRDYERDKNKALEELSKLIKSEHVEGRSVRPASTPALGTTRSSSSVRMVPPEWLSHHMLAHKDTGRSQEPVQPQYQPRGQHAKKQSQIPVSSTVAQLRRMNSQVSSYSNAASGYSDGSSNGPFLRAVAEGGASPIVSPPRNRRDSARNYFALGSPPKTTPGSSGVNDKENNSHEASSSHGSRIPRLDVTIERGPLTMENRSAETPRSKRPTRHQRDASGGGGGGGGGAGARARASEDSLGLYDMDGFWISPERLSRSNGFRM